MLARDPKQGGDLAPGLAGRRNHILAQQFAWVSGYRFRSRLATYRPWHCSSMVLLEIDTESIPGIELEGDTPRTIDVDRVAG